MVDQEDQIKFPSLTVINQNFLKIISSLILPVEPVQVTMKIYYFVFRLKIKDYAINQSILLQKYGGNGSHTLIFHMLNIVQFPYHQVSHSF